MWRMLMCAVIFSFLAAGSVTFSADEASLAQQAESSGDLRGALTHYVAALQAVSENSSQDTQLREKIISLVQKISPVPVLPGEAIEYEGRAEAAAGMAQTQADFMDAAKEYKKALFVAPWSAKDYFNLAVVLDKAGKQQEAIRSLNFYLLAAPNAPDKTEVQKKIAGLKYQLEKTASSQAAEKQKQTADETLAARLAGIWQNTHNGGFRIRVDVNGTKIRIIVIGIASSRGYQPANQLWEDGEIKGGRFVGTYYNFTYGSDEGNRVLGTQSVDYKITVSDDGSKFKTGDNDWQNTIWSSIFIKE